MRRRAGGALYLEVVHVHVDHRLRHLVVGKGFGARNAHDQGLHFVAAVEQALRENGVDLREAEQILLGFSPVFVVEPGELLHQSQHVHEDVGVAEHGCLVFVFVVQQRREDLQQRFLVEILEDLRAELAVVHEDEEQLHDGAQTAVSFRAVALVVQGQREDGHGHQERLQDGRFSRVHGDGCYDGQGFHAD